ncbi:Guanylyl cyclase [Halteromyces radiatus]|uniref:Guanylyl cyclase n=1 Tax=Halteromyces radiatus TaxID=101107 RepID=UPI002220270E|nr:Guanylyl cyclase [Halteromyces radiatus]KAI8084621.1 Guanylyl cyclase [Halteromyces radiatus]
MSIFCCGSIEESDMANKYIEFDQHIVPHVMQNTNWDCGLACVAMLLGGMNLNLTLNELMQQCAVESVWTIDLAFLLRKYVGDFTYYTSYFGSRKEYQDDSFYQANFDQDELRVNRLFSIAKSSSIHVVRMVLPLDDFKRFLYCKKFAMITLVNARFLNCPICKEHQSCVLSACGQLNSFMEKVKGNDYLGHFVVLIGYDPNEDMFIYRDPAVEDKFCVISAKDLDHARQAEGTDHDCIVIQL